jgi:hypothetical protein
MSITTYHIGGTRYNLTIDKIDIFTSTLCVTDSNKNIIDFPENAIVYFYDNETKNILEKINQKYYINNDMNYELQINNIVWSIKNERKWDFELRQI